MKKWRKKIVSSNQFIVYIKSVHYVSDNLFPYFNAENCGTEILKNAIFVAEIVSVGHWKS